MSNAQQEISYAKWTGYGEPNNWWEDWAHPANCARFINDKYNNEIGWTEYKCDLSSGLVCQRSKACPNCHTFDNLNWFQSAIIEKLH